MFFSSINFTNKLILCFNKKERQTIFVKFCNCNNYFIVELTVKVALQVERSQNLKEKLTKRKIG